MHKKFDTLSKKDKIQLLRISIFGIESTSLTAVIELLKFQAEEKEIFLEFIYFLNSEDWIILEKDQFRLTTEAKEFILENYPPRAENMRYIIELFISISKPDIKPMLNNNTEILLLRALSYISGVSGELALLNDYYAQYLNSIKNHKSAANFFELAVEIQTKVNDKDVRLCNYINHLSETYMLLNQKDKALNLAFKAKHLAYNLPVKDQIVLVYSYSLISTIYFRQRNYKNSYENILKAVELAEQNKLNKIRLSTLYYETSIVAAKVGKMKNAKQYIDQAYLLIEPQKSEFRELVEMIGIQKRYLNLLKRMDNPIIKFSKLRYIFIVLFVIVLIIFAAIFII